MPPRYYYIVSVVCSNLPERAVPAGCGCGGRRGSQRLHPVQTHLHGQHDGRQQTEVSQRNKGWQSTAVWLVTAAHGQHKCSIKLAQSSLHLLTLLAAVGQGVVLSTTSALAGVRRHVAAHATVTQVVAAGGFQLGAHAPCAKRCHAAVLSVQQDAVILSWGVV